MESPVNPTVHPIDLAIIVLYMVGVVLFGMWIGRGQKDLSSYLLGDRNIPWWGLMGSIVATETSTATFLSVPGIAYAQGGDLRFLQLAMGFVVGRILVSFCLLPLFFKGELFSAYEVLQQRFGNRAKQAASLMFLVARNLGDGLRLYLAGLVLQQAAGIDLRLSIVIMGTLTIIYTFFGGMKAIVWTDCIQFVVYVSGGVLALCLLTTELPDGWGGFQEFASSRQKWRFLDLSFNLNLPYTLWAGMFGGVLLTMGTHGTDQMMVQRYLSSRSQRDAAMALVGSGIVVFIQFLLFLMVGVALAAYYEQFPPLKEFERPDQVFASYIVTRMPIGCVGILLAAVVSAAMSTLSSSLNSSASAAVNDLYLPLRRIDANSRAALIASRGFSVGFGILQILVGLAASRLSDSVVNNALAIAGFTAGILLGMFGLGVLTRHVGQKGVLGGMAIGMAVLTGVKFGTSIAWPWYALIGFTATSLGGLVSSSCLEREEH